MARQLVVFALIFIALVGMVMANEAPLASPKSSPSPSPKSSPSAPTSSPKASTSSPSSSPVSSPASSPSSEEEGEISSPPAPASDPIELFAPGSEPYDDAFSPDDHADTESYPSDETSGTSALQMSVIAVVAVVGFFAF